MTNRKKRTWVAWQRDNRAHPYVESSKRGASNHQIFPEKKSVFQSGVWSFNEQTKNLGPFPEKNFLRQRRDMIGKKKAGRPNGE